MRCCAAFFAVLLVVNVCLETFCFFPFKLKAAASSTGTFTFTFAQNVTTASFNFQNFTNTYSFPVNVRVYVQCIDNRFLLRNFTLSLNDTSFIVVLDGVTVQSENVFYGLQPSTTLVYNAFATPASTVNSGDTVTVTYVTEVYEAAVPVLPLVPPPTRLFDVKITVLPTSVVYVAFFYTSFPVTINIVNRGVDADATVKWEVVDLYGRVVSSEQFTVYVKSSENKTLTFMVPTPSVGGVYTLNVDVISPAFAHSQKTFTVTIFPLTFMFILVLSAALLLLAVAVHRKLKKH